jgi:hypothetical protein
VIGELGPEICWLTSYVTDDKLYCVYVAPDEDILFEHARWRLPCRPHLQGLNRHRPVDRGRRRHGHSLRTALNATELLASRDIQIQ